jgi:hypothetical protein
MAVRGEGGAAPPDDAPHGEPVPAGRGKTGVRMAFAALALLFVLQVVLLGGGAGEPYPGLMMPGFAGSGGFDAGEVRTKRMEAVLVHAGGETAVSQRRLLAPYPDSHHASIARTFLSPPQVDAPLKDYWLRRVLPRVGRRSRGAGPVDPSLCAWARGRAAALLPGVAVRRMEIRWHVDTFRVGSHAPVAREPLGQLVIPLDREAGCGG